jgi:succinyl-diaminopimelate desuccinylase
VAVTTVDWLGRTAELVDIASPSLGEGPFANVVEARLRAVPWLTVDRLGDNVVARTELGREHRVVLAGHLDTVPANGNERPRIQGDTLWGLGSTDMKSGLAVFLELAATVPEPVVDVSYVFYAAEEIAAQHSGLLQLLRERPELVHGDVAVLGEPTDGALEAGCQGTARLRVMLRGSRAHTARPWMGRNAIHRLGRVLAAIDAHEPRQPTIDGCTFREAVQAVFVEGGVAGNVVPDEATLTVNLRVAPDRTLDEGIEAFRQLVSDELEDGDHIDVVDAAPPAAPSLTHPVLARLVDQGLEVRAKLGWTDVARFAQAGIPAVNLGPGDATVAHTAGEHVRRESIERVHVALHRLLTER